MKRTFSSSVALLWITAAALSLVGCYDPPKNNSGNAVNYAPSNTNSDLPAKQKPVETNQNTSKEKERQGFTGNLPPGFSRPESSVENTLLGEYGAMFVARGVTVPTTIVFKDEAEVSAFQARMQITGETLDGKRLELQAAAMDDLRKAIGDAKAQGVSISPRDVDSARRSYDETVGLWKSRVDPALTHWVSKGKLTQTDADRISALSPFEQVPEVLKLEEKGIFFAKDLSKSIIYSVAPPGSSQHLSLLALDVREHENEKVRAVLAKHKWYQTVVSDLPHFTYLGAEEAELPSLGLKKVSSGGRIFWVPDI